MGRRFGVCGGLQVVSRGRCAGRRSLGIGALGGVVSVGVHGAGGPGDGGVGRGSGTCLRRGAFGWRVCWALRRPVRCAMVLAGLQVGLCRRCPAARRLATGWCLGLWSRASCGARGWVRVRVCRARGFLGSGAYCPSDPFCTPWCHVLCSTGVQLTSPGPLNHP